MAKKKTTEQKVAEIATRDADYIARLKNQPPPDSSPRYVEYWYTSRNYKESQGIENHGVSMTIPDQSLSIQEILQMYTSGITPDVQHDGYFESENGDVSFDDYDVTRAPDVDPVDVQAEMDHLRREVSSRRQESLKNESAAKVQEASTAVAEPTSQTPKENPPAPTTT